MLLIIEALLLISAALGQDHRAADEGQIITLDMAPNSVDDQYKDCKKEMAKLVETKYLKKELNNSKYSNFSKAWESGQKKFSSRLDNFKKFKKNHKVAIWVYTDPKYKTYVKFNSDTRKDKQNYRVKAYKWYSLHFLLTDAIQILKKKQTRCFKTFRGTNVIFNGHVSTNIRFGSFTSSSVLPGRAYSFGNVSCFVINTCEGANITKYSRTPYEAEVLIPPYEMFNVIDVRTKTDRNNLRCQTEYVLNSTGIQSNLNCALFNKPAKTIKYYGLNKVL